MRRSGASSTSASRAKRCSSCRRAGSRSRAASLRRCSRPIEERHVDVVLRSSFEDCAVGAASEIDDPIWDTRTTRTSRARARRHCRLGVGTCRRLRDGRRSRSPRRRRSALLIGPETVEAAKIACGSAWKTFDRPSTEVAGRDRITGLPRRTTITSEQVRSATEQSVGQIVEAVKRTLESTPPELVADISSSGMLHAGGGALLPGIDQRLAAETGVHVSVAEAPLQCVALGAGSALEEPGALDRMARRQTGALALPPPGVAEGPTCHGGGSCVQRPAPR